MGVLACHPVELGAPNKLDHRHDSTQPPDENRHGLRFCEWRRKLVLRLGLSHDDQYQFWAFPELRITRESAGDECRSAPDIIIVGKDKENFCLNRPRMESARIREFLVYDRVENEPREENP